jgi:hypothetical protein
MRSGLMLLLAVATFGVFACAANAQNSCGALWYERNSIYAAAGHCFETARAIASFGRGCVPPYGRLTPSQQRRVNAIRAAERRLGC